MCAGAFVGTLALFFSTHIVVVITVLVVAVVERLPLRSSSSFVILAGLPRFAQDIFSFFLDLFSLSTFVSVFYTLTNPPFSVCRARALDDGRAHRGRPHK